MNCFDISQHINHAVRLPQIGKHNPGLPGPLKWESRILSISKRDCEYWSIFAEHRSHRISIPSGYSEADREIHADGAQSELFEIPIPQASHLRKRSENIFAAEMSGTSIAGIDRLQPGHITEFSNGIKQSSIQFFLKWSASLADFGCFAKNEKPPHSVSRTLGRNHLKLMSFALIIKIWVLVADGHVDDDTTRLPPINWLFLRIFESRRGFFEIAPAHFVRRLLPANCANGGDAKIRMQQKTTARGSGVTSASEEKRKPESDVMRRTFHFFFRSVVGELGFNY
jgi:hypothetical protein